MINFAHWPCLVFIVFGVWNLPTAPNLSSKPAAGCLSSHLSHLHYCLYGDPRSGQPMLVYMVTVSPSHLTCLSSITNHLLVPRFTFPQPDTGFQCYWLDLLIPSVTRLCQTHNLNQQPFLQRFPYSAPVPAIEILRLPSRHTWSRHLTHPEPKSHLSVNYSVKAKGHHLNITQCWKMAKDGRHERVISITYHQQWLRSTV